MVISNYIIGGKTVESAIKFNMPIKKFYDLVDGKIGFADESTRRIVTEFVKNEYGIALPKENSENCNEYLRLECLGKVKMVTKDLFEFADATENSNSEHTESLDDVFSPDSTKEVA